MFMWDQISGLSERLLNMLLRLLRERDFNPLHLPESGKTLRKFATTLPQCRTETFNVNLEVTEPSLPRDPNFPFGPLPKIRKTPILYNNPLDLISLQLLAPETRSKFRFGVEEPSPSVAEFNQSMYCKNIRKYRDLLGIRWNGASYNVGDFIEMKNGNISWIETFFYTLPSLQNPNALIKPILKIKGFKFLQGSRLGELFATKLSVEFCPSEISRIINVNDNLGFYFCQQFVTGEAFDVRQQLFTCPKVMLGDIYIHLEIFLDKYTSKSSRNRSTMAVYASYSNVCRVYKHFPDFTDVLMLLPPGVNLEEALTPLRRDIQELEKGFNFRDGDGKTKLIEGGISLLPADLVQVSQNCRHGGVASTYPCPQCYALQEDFQTADFNLNHQDNLKSGVGLEILIEAVERKRKEDQLSESQTNELRKRIGNVLLRQQIFEKIDIPMISFKEPQHLFLANLFPSLVNEIIALIPKRNREELFVRIRDIPWASQATRLTVNVMKQKFGQNISFTLRTQVAFAMTFSAIGLVEEKYLKHFIEFFRFGIRYLSGEGFTPSNIPDVQATGLKIYQDGLKLFPQTWTLPVGHGFFSSRDS
jgi:hypothetical protein